MSPIVFTSVFSLGLLAALAASQSPGKVPDEAMTPLRAAELFDTNCSACHVAPDPAYATDRAWIGQLRETA